MADHSNFITPPDFISSDSEDINNATVLVIDADWIDVEHVAAFCKTSDKAYNVYLYSSEMDNLPWLHDAERRATAIIINTASTVISSIKDKWAEKDKAFFYGPKSSLKNQKNQLRKLTDYFINDK